MNCYFRDVSAETCPALQLKQMPEFTLKSLLLLQGITDDRDTFSEVWKITLSPITKKAFEITCSLGCQCLHFQYS
jgi:hypothetical protein